MTTPAPCGISTLRDVRDLLDALERDHPVDRWRVGSVGVWPIVRIRLGYALQATVADLPAPNPDTGIRDVAHRFGAAVAGVGRSIHVPTRRFGAGGAAGAAAAVFLSDGVSLVDDDGETRDRHCDPLRSALADERPPPLLLLPGRARARGLRPPVRRVQAALDVAAARGRFGAVPTVEAPGWAEMDRRLADEGLAGVLPSRATIGHAANVVDHMARVFAKHLRRARARVGLVAEYYALRSMAFVLACRRTGVDSVDLQHGVQGPLHFAYGGISSPSEGWDLLPDWFWVWHEDDAATIDEWAADTRHRTIVGGNPDLVRWLSPQGGSREEARDRPLAARFACHGTRHVLVTLSGYERDDELTRLGQVVARSPASWRWWVRGHPARARHLGTATVTTLGVDPGDAELATTLPLYALLRHVDVHLTRNSSVVLDAVPFGVPSVVVDPSGVELFASEIGSGAAVAALGDPAAVVAALAAAPPARRDAPEAHAAQARIDAGLRWLRGRVHGVAA